MVRAPLSLASLLGYPASSFERDQQTWLATEGLLTAPMAGLLGWACPRRSPHRHAQLPTSPCPKPHALPAHPSHLLPCESPALAVGGTVHVEVERGGQPLAADIRVQDLHAGASHAGPPTCMRIFAPLSHVVQLLLAGFQMGC